jgi:hypothetical protein
MEPAMDGRFSEKHLVGFHGLLGFLARVPAVQTNDTPWGGFGSGDEEDGRWWVRFGIDIHHPLAWHAVQEFAYVLNLLSNTERLPSVFKPVSPPPYLNGGPDEYLSWVIEVHDPEMTPGRIAEWLQSRFPNPVDDATRWSHRDVAS